MAARPADERFMRLALDEARKGLGRTHPNPAVGAVVVKGGKVIARGFHARAGTAHAEAVALAQAGARAKGATLYSTLEPCDHFGRTPPCTQAILEHGVRRVVYGSADPNPLVDGKGVRRLRRAGVAVTGGVLEAECDALNEPFLKVMRSGLPFVTVKAGVTLDGKIATAAGRSKWITSEAARASAHGLRDRVDAIVVGAGTVLADDPALTTRVPGGRHAVRVVLDPRLRTAPTAKVYASNGPRVVVVTARPAGSVRTRAFSRRGVEVLTVAAGPAGLDLDAALRALARQGALHVLVEGGAHTIGRFLSAGLVDELVLYMAPAVFGADGLSWAGALGVRRVDEAPRFRFEELASVDGDVRLRLRAAR
ncbi:MAG: bifunctional diaminohydroxyphosphoribosylaminopyrimidine deaminase/5-amino-6-(5-phosphoribosylamino)uracil reductase RibD [Myxococcaceae bacterium]|jgi:diaminohydroxyphosphoribosylaminopyrimidine deaminase/5-amino-6-(5-phosphoribosylamino)uracil reductase|nr:bifunctional diaminohydroxyphosphoribosylaminopyrimidine deaminase/5-amino-6-(5-phosphoribosylamino)uracil reductase RibD [Myxococcaceae bacterium]